MGGLTDRRLPHRTRLQLASRAAPIRSILLRVLPGRRPGGQQAPQPAGQVLVVGAREGLVQEVPRHAHAIPAKASSAVSLVMPLVCADPGTCARR
jgi:hypothetical protein